MLMNGTLNAPYVQRLRPPAISDI